MLGDYLAGNLRFGSLAGNGFKTLLDDRILILEATSRSRRKHGRHADYRAAHLFSKSDGGIHRLVA